MKDIENNFNLIKGPGMTIEELYWTEKEKEFFDETYIFRVKDLWEIKKMLVDVAKEYLAMSDEELSDITPFDVLNDVNKLI